MGKLSHLPHPHFPHKKFSFTTLPTKLLHRLKGKKEFVSYVPSELLVYIFEFLSVQDLCNVIKVNSTWRIIGYDGYLWKSQSLKYFENPVNRVARQLPGRYADEHWKTYFTRRYLANQQWKANNLSQTTITGHAGTVWTLAFDNEKLVTGSFDKTIKV
jgi:hypothetical protein